MPKSSPCGTRRRRASLSLRTTPAIDPPLPLPFDTFGLVCVRGEDGEAFTNIPQRHIQHSPDGFEWGYAGSGPADLALNIADLLWPLESGEGIKLWGGTRVSERAWELHEVLKKSILMHIDKSGGHVSRATLQQWEGQVYLRGKQK